MTLAAPLDLVACPVCHADLALAAAAITCTGCARRFRANAVLDLTPLPPPDAELAERWYLWERLQANFVAAANARPEHSLSVTERPDVTAFARFCAFDGSVLDIGCGTQPLPTYADATRCRLIGLDPLAGDEPRRFEFVQGLGEYLPFRSGSFDQALFATSLDHMLVPSRAVVEAARVVRPGGSVTVWFGEVDRPPVTPPPPGLAARARSRLRRTLRGPDPPEQEPEYLAQLEQFEGAIDKFHVAHPDLGTIVGWLEAAGLTLDGVERIDFANGCFVRGVKPAGVDGQPRP